MLLKQHPILLQPCLSPITNCLQATSSLSIPTVCHIHHTLSSFNVPRPTGYKSTFPVLSSLNSLSSDLTTPTDQITSTSCLHRPQYLLRAVLIILSILSVLLTPLATSQHFPSSILSTHHPVIWLLLQARLYAHRNLLKQHPISTSYLNIQSHSNRTKSNDYCVYRLRHYPQSLFACNARQTLIVSEPADILGLFNLSCV